VTGLEIERVWVLRQMPDLPSAAERWEIEQGYLPDATSNGPQFPEGRLRRIRTNDGRVRCFHTVKRGDGLVREETEREIDEREFERLWPLTQGRRIEKTRTRVSEGGLIWEVDRFHALPLVMVEVELPDVRAKAPLPAWLASHVLREVTDDPRYRNAAIAIEGLPRT
jgi:CYTH domain-containing protein